ncbi:TspO/MBR family protein [uncultured Robinsoniella sp.]|uniref:TspO/MBR family protein n=1 Tax=uncultured Robinsoniella sp. TaxID=904190 RepID=UPI00374E25AE
MKIKFDKLIISILIPLAVGQISSLLTRSPSDTYEMLAKSSVSPPGVIFPIVWTILYFLMGISCYLIITSGSEDTKNALIWYALQLTLNFFWSLIFFNLQFYLFAFFWLILLIACIIIMIIKFYKINPLAAYLQIPYLLWCIFAAYLNLSIYLLNK